jgi:hypothetical protein
MRGAFAAGNMWHRPARRVASATGKGAIALRRISPTAVGDDPT